MSPPFAPAAAPSTDEALLAALAAILADDRLEPAFVALALTPPGEADIAREIGRDIDPDAISRRAQGAARRASASALGARSRRHMSG